MVEKKSLVPVTGTGGYQNPLVFVTLQQPARLEGILMLCTPWV